MPVLLIRRFNGFRHWLGAALADQYHVCRSLLRLLQSCAGASVDHLTADNNRCRSHVDSGPVRRCCFGRCKSGCRTRGRACSSDGQRSPWSRRRHASSASQRCQEPASGGDMPRIPASRRNADTLASAPCSSMLTSAAARLTATRDSPGRVAKTGLALAYALLPAASLDHTSQWELNV